jgi:hypothetical protein
MESCFVSASHQSKVMKMKLPKPNAMLLFEWTGATNGVMMLVGVRY